MTDDPKLSPYAEETLQALIKRARVMMASMQDGDIAVMARAANVLMNQWQGWYAIIRRRPGE